MDIKWIEDFLCFCDRRSFSRAAGERHVSQSAFSRRIQALEDWLGVALIDRNCQPPALTAAGRVFRNFAADHVRRLYEARALLRGQHPENGEALRFAVAHTLSLTFFPDWFAALRQRFSQIQAQVQATNIMEGAHLLSEGATDLLLCYHHPQFPILLDPDRHPFVVLGSDRLLPYSACAADGRPHFTLPGQRGVPPPLLAYAADTFLGRLVEMILLDPPQPCHPQTCFQTHMSEALKAMVLAGHGLGWLPESCVHEELAAGRIAQAGSADWGTRMEIRVYRAAANHRAGLDTLWQHLARGGDEVR